ETRDPEGKFKPNVVNTVVFLVSTVQQVTTFAANYAGYPFMQAIGENKKLYRTIMILCGICFACALNWFPEFNEYMQISELPSEEFRNNLIALMIADLFISITWERLCRSFLRKVPHSLVRPILDYPNEKLVTEIRKKHINKKIEERQKQGDTGLWAQIKKQSQMIQKIQQEQAQTQGHLSSKR
ncbi:hypothetical protein RFI_30843, partial [Reticulomyxa filosa]